ncbi:MAG: ubiquinone/menaquinone biosynthesis C-methylase UbiE [Parasphingorhabdus sp.]|jgi:ubiquinone/menaquinone biosynthesis C-methylase UbiE
MTDSHSAFVGEIPQNYEKYLGPLIFREYAEDLANRVIAPSGGVVLETAAGTGMATRQLRDSLADNVHLVATDLNADMLDVAKSKFQNDENIEFQTANALELPFKDATFDAVACQFSVMFFPDKLVALQEAARVLKPGGAFVFNIWDSFEHNHFIRTTNSKIAECLPDNPPDFFGVPYGYYNIDVIKELLYRAGFADIEISVLPRTSFAENARQVALGYVTGSPVRLQIEKIDAASLHRIVDQVEQAIGKEFGFESVTAKMQAIVFTAHLPE